MNKRSSTTVLVIEDDPIVRKGIVLYLQNSGGYIMLQAADGQEGIAIFRRESPDLILTDLRLPKLDGLDILATIRKESPNIPVIIVSGMGTRDDAVKALKLGAMDYVTKPIHDMHLLEYAIQHVLERVRLLGENRRYQNFLEEEVEKKTAELNQSQKLEALGTLAGGIAHDFNNILAAVMGFTDLALLKIEKDSTVRNDLLQIKIAGNRARDLVLQILTFSRKSAATHRPLQASLIVREVVKLLRATLPATVELTQNISAPLAMINADPTEFHQVITNLVTNSFHALKNELGEISLQLDKRTLSENKVSEFTDLPTGDYLQLVVHDNGCGMDKITANKIFDPFFTTKDKGKGTGLGLSVVHGIVKNNGGSISVKSIPEKGTTFTLLFPLIPDTTTEEAKTVVTPPGGNEHILLVDDEKPLRDMVKQILEYIGYSVTCSASGRDALEKIKAYPDRFDLLITDQSMPHMPGTELALSLQTICPEMPVLLCSGYSAVVDEKKALSMGIQGFLMKPLSINNLTSKIREVLDAKY